MFTLPFYNGEAFAGDYKRLLFKPVIAAQAFHDGLHEKIIFANRKNNNLPLVTSSALMTRFLLLSFFLFIFFSPLKAQKKFAAKKYPSLFWEITGKGLKKPSYLFGTMHVSSKMVFHLSDSFYFAMRNADAVALELNPEIWQDEMFRLQKAQLNLSKFSLGKMDDYLKENSFALDRYEDNIKRALTEEPTIVNNLLYRTYQPTADFEENTYLDLYIYQTGRKLGKQPAGVENYLESERLMMEAYTDMAKDKSKKRADPDGESLYDIQKKLQQAYRNGDLDLLDSFQTLTATSAAFSEKFLYLRNEIQAASIDTIMKKQSLFVGVGAAHLPGPRGVIELLRKKGYKLRPIHMQDRDANQKDEIDKLKVPVHFVSDTTADKLIELKLPGKLYQRGEARANESWQYADMSNGAYYMLTRVRTHAVMIGHNEKMVLHKVDSMLYENIPGKILKKTPINKNGYSGFDILNRTRRGDMQRYQIMVTPYEVLVFKMSGNNDYVEGDEANSFFTSIVLKPHAENNWREYKPAQGGFKIQLPAEPVASLNKITADNMDTWEYESLQHNTGNAFMLWKKSLYNTDFVEEDTFDIGLIQESFKSSELISRQLSRKLGLQNHHPFLECKYLLKEGGYITTRAFLQGPHYFLLAARSKDKKAGFAGFFNSFQFSPYKYPKPEKYIDTILKMQALTPVKPQLDSMLRSWMEKATNDAISASNVGYSAWPKNKTAVFKSDSTGESVLVSVQTFPKYFYSRDSLRFWNDKLTNEEVENDMLFSKKDFFKLNDSVCGYNVVLTDTNSSRCIRAVMYLKGNSLYKFSTVTDTSNNQSEFIQSFFATASPLDDAPVTSVFSNKLNLFFTDYNSPDSLLSKQANSAIENIYFGKEGIAPLVSVINNLKFGDNDYFEKKSKFITELSYISDSSAKDNVVAILKDIYERNADTIYFQNPVLAGLARLKTDSSFRLLKHLLIQDPPIFDDNYEYEKIFSQFSDTLRLAKILFPEILQLAALEDYKPYINSLLKSMVDSGLLNANDYESYFSKLYFDAKIELKKQQNKDEKQLGLESNSDDDEDNSTEQYGGMYRTHNYTNSPLDDYAVLLMPFYDKFNSVPKFFDKLLLSKDVNVQIGATKVLLNNHKPVADSLIYAIALKDQYRAALLYMLEQVNRKGLFPAEYASQQTIAKAMLLNEKNYKDFTDIQFVKKRTIEVKGKKGAVFFFKYKLKKEADWKIAFSGLQPLNANEVSSNSDFVKLTGKKLRAETNEINEFEEQLKRLIFAKHKSGSNFYEEKNAFGYDYNYED